ncbi:MAG: HTH-type transcriptional repressor FabR [Bacteriovoracaceae bacterium]|jgi:AcrR family transcriptional regulator
MLERSEQKLQTRKKLIEAALRLSAERGFGAISLREISKEAGITPAGFYRHFHNLEELGLILIDEVGLGLRQLLREARRKQLDHKGSAIQASVETFIQYITENANLFRVLQGERQGPSSAFRKSLFAEINRFVEEVAEDLDRGSKILNQPLRDTALAAEAIVAVAFTVGAEALDLPKHRRKELSERLIKELKMILRGARDLRPQAKKKIIKKKN